MALITSILSSTEGIFDRLSTHSPSNLPLSELTPPSSDQTRKTNKMNITIDDISPQISYGPSVNGWKTDHSGDPSTSEYFRSTFHSTFNDGDYMQFDFNGTAIYVYGAYRANHGLYSTQLDGGNLGYSIGYASPDEYQYPIYFSKGLDPTTQHRITITNLPSQTTPPGNATIQWYLDIDYIVITTAVISGEVYTTVYDDFSPAFTFSDEFTGYPNFGNGYFNGTNHLTYNTSASVTFPFNGSSVQLFGGVNVDHGNYSVVLDGGLNQVYNGSSQDLYVNASLYLATNLTEGPHVVTITNIGTIPGQRAFDFDFAVVNSTVSPNLGNNGTNSTTTPSDPSAAGESGAKDSEGGSNTAAIAGGVAGGIVALLLLGAALWFFCIPKRRSHGRGKPYEPVDLAIGPVTHDYSDGAEVAPFPTSTTALSSAPSLSSPSITTHPMSQLGHSHGGFLTSIPPPPSSNATSYPRSAAGGTSPTTTQHDPNTENPSRPFGSSARGMERDDSSISHVPTSPPRNLSSTKASGVTLPYTAARPSAPRRTVSSMEDRYSVPGREMDMGPADLSEDGHQDGLLPPDYQQATQPLPGQRRPVEQ